MNWTTPTFEDAAVGLEATGYYAPGEAVSAK